MSPAAAPVLPAADRARVDPERIRALRRRHGWRRETLASNARVGFRTIQRLERGEGVPTGQTLERVAAALGVDPAALLSPPEDAP